MKEHILNMRLFFPKCMYLLHHIHIFLNHAYNIKSVTAALTALNHVSTYSTELAFDCHGSGAVCISDMLNMRPQFFHSICFSPSCNCKFPHPLPLENKQVQKHVLLCITVMNQA